MNQRTPQLNGCEGTFYLLATLWARKLGSSGGWEFTPRPRGVLLLSRHGQGASAPFQHGAPLSTSARLQGVFSEVGTKMSRSPRQSSKRRTAGNLFMGQTAPQRAQNPLQLAALSIRTLFADFNMGSSKKVSLSVLSREQSEGVGARVRRSIGRPELKNLDPFLLLDEFKGGRPGGFPDHPHRGFETVSYLLEGGSMAHEDFCGHVGKMNPGDLQWMTAGRGILHAEMPCSEEPAHGLQLWVNLRSSEKMVEPQYQELKSEEIPKPSKDGVTIAVISGEALGMKGERFVPRTSF
ncbi:pirin isoform X3 [Tamandua tetradactyla]|uniref:pirin isoform X3 n=1 Tax=Tamandua tetradactyla TaxID=48850 RepID=UPI004053EC97